MGRKILLYGNSVFVTGILYSLPKDYQVCPLPEAAVSPALGDAEIIFFDMSDARSLRAIPQLIDLGIPLAGVDPERNTVVIFSGHSRIINTIKDLTQLFKDALPKNNNKHDSKEIFGMNAQFALTPISPNQRSVTHLTGLKPQVVDRNYLKALQVSVQPSEETMNALIRGSRFFEERLANGKIVPRPRVELAEIDLNSEFEIHNYTGACPVLTYEINPVQGCNVGCLYCLVTDGVHEQELKAYTNYHLLVRRILKEKNGERHYYYFSPKTEAFQEPTLQTGIAHNILREFIAHFDENPKSLARVFIASKAGIKQLMVEHEGETILDLFVKLKGRMQFNTSVSIMPDYLRDALEPFAAPIEERLEAVKVCQANGVMANSALVQPIVAPYLTDENMREFFAKLRDAGIINFKPEFLTACMENLAMIGQLQGYYDKQMEKTLYEYYIAPENSDHRKQRGRTAPNRDLSRMYFERLMNIAAEYGITTSVCYWVRGQLKISTKMVPLVNANGFQCLGYQRRLFDDHDPEIENNPEVAVVL